MADSWTLQELVAECAAKIAALPAPKNGQVRAVPDDRTIRYYATLGLLDRPAAMRGRTALYTARHLAQVVAIKRLQAMGRSLQEIQTLWPTLDDHTLARMSGVHVAGTPANPAPASTREAFWKREPVEKTASPPPGHPVEKTASPPPGHPVAKTASPAPSSPVAADYDVRASVRALDGVATELTISIELAPNISITLPMPSGVALSHADVRAIRAAAAPLVTELARRQLTPHA